MRHILASLGNYLYIGVVELLLLFAQPLRRLSAVGVLTRVLIWIPRINTVCQLVIVREANGARINCDITDSGPAPVPIAARLSLGADRQL